MPADVESENDDERCELLLRPGCGIAQKDDCLAERKTSKVAGFKNRNPGEFILNSEALKHVHRILEQDSSSHLNVLVQMAPDDLRVRELTRQTSKTIAMRSAIISARELTPPRQSRVASRSTASDAATAKSATVQSADLQAAPRRRAGRAADSPRHLLNPLLDWVRAVGAARSNASPPVVFASSGSALVSVRRDRLEQMVHDLPAVEAVYRNQKVTVPPVAKSRSLPPVVVDNKAHVWGISRTGAMACWGAFNARGANVKIAVLDTGIDADHPDLKGKVADFAEFDAKGQLVQQGVAKAYDSDSHGTHVAGTLVGGQASGRWIGMAPEAKILAGLVLKGGTGTDAQILAGMNWALESGADIINLSLGGLRMSADVLDTYTRMIIAAHLKGVPVIVAVGNEGSQTTSSPGNDYFAFTVGATDVDDRAAGFSGGRTQIIETSRYIDRNNLPLVYSKPDVSAPGLEIYSSIPNGKWAAYSGSSMATPHVSGAMAIMLSALQGLRDLKGSEKRVSVVQHLLISSVRELGEAGQNHRFGYGRIDVLRACGFGLDLGY